MSEIFEIPEGINKDRFRTVANRLLNESFIVKCDKDLQADYLYVIDKQSAFESLFDILGYRVVINSEYGVISLNNEAGTGRIHLTKMESILLLIFRLLYIENKMALRQNSDIAIALEDVNEKYQIMKLKQKLKPDVLQKAISKFRRIHLIQPLDRVDPNNPGMRLLIYPSIICTMSANSLEEMYNLAKTRLAEFDNREPTIIKSREK